jgi:hypothetical protein
MANVRYGHIIGNTCVAIITFDPDLTSVDEMQGSYDGTLLPISDFAGGQWGVGATWDGVTITQAGTVGMDPVTTTDSVNELQSQVDNLVDALASTITNAATRSVTVTTASNGQAVVTWPTAFAGVPQVAAIARNAAANNYTINVELLAVSSTGATLRAWRLASTSAAVLSGAVLNVIAYGPA